MCNCFVTNMGKVIPQSRMALLVMGVMAEPPTLFFMWKLLFEQVLDSILSILHSRFRLYTLPTKTGLVLWGGGYGGIHQHGGLMKTIHVILRSKTS